MQPECDIAAPGDPRRIRRIPAHREQEHADAEEQDKAEDGVAHFIDRYADPDDQQGDGQARDRRPTGCNGDRHMEPLPMDPGSGRGDCCRGSGHDSAERLIVVEPGLADREHQRKYGRREHADDER